MNETGGIPTHKDLDIWNLGIELVEEIYRITANFPKEEIYSLISQLRRAAISILSNINTFYYKLRIFIRVRDTAYNK